MVVMKSLRAIRRAAVRFNLKTIDWVMEDGMLRVEVANGAGGGCGLNHRELIMSVTDFLDLRADGLLWYHKNASRIQEKRFRDLMATDR